VLAVGGGGNAQAQVSLDRGTAHVVSNTGQLELRGRAGVAVLTPGQSGTLDGAGVAVADVKEPSAADVTVPGGESPVVHSPRGAAAVRIRFDGVCAGDALVDVGSGRATRTMFVSGALSAVVVPLAVGAHRYRVRCVDAGVPGVKASLAHADRAERVFVRARPNVLAIVPPAKAHQSALMLRSARVDAHLRPGEALRLRIIEPRHVLPDLPEAITVVRLRVLNAPEGGAEVLRGA